MAMHKDIEALWDAHHFSSPSEVQEKSYTPIVAGKDVILAAPTGSGKTLAFILPLLERIQKSQGSQLFILLPSQELAGQVGDVAKKWGEALGLRTQKLIGGANIKRQIEGLKKAPEIIVGTPGRINELLMNKKLKAHHLKALVLDEADVLLDDEHVALTKELIKRLPIKIQTILSSATMTEATIADKQIVSEDYIYIEAEEELNQNVQYAVINVPVRKREDLLRQLAHVEGMQALVFVRTIVDIEKLHQKLNYHQIANGYLHRQTSGETRQQQLAAFKNKKLTYLLTTDVAARGMDIPDLPYVIEYDYSCKRDQYIHRSGRTGRMGKAGCVLSFVNKRGQRELQQIVPTKLTPLFVYKGQLLTETAYTQAKQEQENAVELHVKKHVSKKRQSQSQGHNEQPKKKKKDRKREQKNKGARRKKG